MLTKNRTKINTALTLLTIVLAMNIAGCSSKKKINPNFTEEQLRTMPAPQRSNLPAPSGGLVLSVNGETLSAREVILPASRMLVESARGKDYPEYVKDAAPIIQRMIKDKVTSILLYQKAKAQISESILEEGGPIDKAVEKEVQKFIASHGGDYSKAQKEIEENGYDWQGFREFKRKMIITQSYFASELEEQKPITHNELTGAYNMLKDQYFKVGTEREFQLVDIDIESFDNKDAALSKANEVLTQAKAGGDFTELVKTHSMGAKAMAGGVWKTSGPGTLNAPYDKVEVEVENLTTGQISDVIESDGHYFIVKVISKQEDGYIPFEKVQGKIEEKLATIKRQQQIDMFLTKMFQDANIGGIEGFIDYCMKQMYVGIRSAGPRK